MTAGYFDAEGQPYVKVRVVLLDLGVSGEVDFLVDTGSDGAILHPVDASRLNCPFDELVNPMTVASAGGPHTYYVEPALISFYDGEARHDFRIDIAVAKPHLLVDGLDSLLGRDILNQPRMDYDLPQSRLEFLPR